MVWQCKIEGEPDDHDWQYHSDWTGDPEVIGGTYNIYFRVCRQCGLEEQLSSEDMPQDDDYY